jgi:hypothetical protein
MCCRFFILEYIIRTVDHGKCRHSLSDGTAGPESARLEPKCHIMLGFAHVLFIVALVCFSLVEGWLANAVRRYGKHLREEQTTAKSESMQLSVTVSRET